MVKSFKKLATKIQVEIGLDLRRKNREKISEAQMFDLLCCQKLPR